MDTTNRLRKNVLGFYFDAVSYETVFDSLLRWHQAGQTHLITLVNPYSVLLGRRDHKMADAIRASAFVLADGVGIIHACRMLGCLPITRVTGPTLMLNICDWSQRHKLRHYFYGSSKSVVEALIEKLKQKYPALDVAGYESPPFRPLTKQEDEQAIRRINESCADVVWVGLGAPKQEIWMLEHLGKIRATAIIGVGAAFDFHSGSKPWAPEWMRRCGIEWIHRLYHEPKRMWRRNLANILFLSKIIIQKVGF